MYVSELLILIFLHSSASCITEGTELFNSVLAQENRGLRKTSTSGRYVCVLKVPIRYSFQTRRSLICRNHDRVRTTSVLSKRDQIAAKNRTEYQFNINDDRLTGEGVSEQRRCWRGEGRGGVSVLFCNNQRLIRHEH